MQMLDGTQVPLLHVPAPPWHDWPSFVGVAPQPLARQTGALHSPAKLAQLSPQWRQSAGVPSGVSQPLLQSAQPASQTHCPA